MRVIAGSRKSLQLKTVAGMNTRPTTDRIKETLFNMIGNNICDGVFLDLFAGSGQMGIEALSRGAKKAYFIENDKKAVACIKDNISHTKFENEAVVIFSDVIMAVNQLSGKEKFDVIFIDPPYHLQYEEKVLQTIGKANILEENGYIIVEADIKTDFSFVSQLGFSIIKEKRYKTNKHVFLEMNGYR